jgi:spermidine/putrescine-binding protein
MDHKLSRRRFLQAGAAVGGAALMGGRLTEVVSAQSPAAPTLAPYSPAPVTGVEAGPLNFLTWSDHYNNDALAQIQASTGIQAFISELADNSDGFAKLQAGNSGLDMVSGDALWVPKYHSSQLVDPFDLSSVAVSDELYSVAKTFDFFTTDAGYLAYPWGWSPIQVVYNPANVSPAPDSWQVLVDPKYKQRVVMERQPLDIMLFAAKATGAVDAYNMTDDELAKAKDWLTQLKPNILTFVEQNNETINKLATGEAWLATQNLGSPDRVKDAGGPEIVAYVPKEGTIGFIDGEMRVTGGANAARITPYLELAADAQWVAQNFLDNGRPLFNERAYKLLVDSGYGDRADRYLYNQPEVALQMTLKGPGGRVQDYLDTFNSVFGA